MTTDQEKTLQALKTAIKMEIDGKAFYLKASRESSNPFGKKLLETLAAEEDGHRRRFEELYEAVSKKRGWVAAPHHFDGGKKIRTLFTEAGSQAIASPGEIDAVKVALDMEKKSYDFYQAQALEAASDDERDFFQSLSGEESVHSLVLVDYFEYLKDPAGWFTNKEHPSLDGA